MENYPTCVEHALRGKGEKGEKGGEGEAESERVEAVAEAADSLSLADALGFRCPERDEIVEKAAFTAAKRRGGRMRKEKWDACRGVGGGVGGGRAGTQKKKWNKEDLVEIRPPAEGWKARMMAR